MTTTDIIDGIIQREGGYVNNPHDAGGPTRYGVTLATLIAWRGGTMCSASDVESLTEQEARQILTSVYVFAPHFYAIRDDALRALVVDCAVNHGVSKAVVLLQRALAVTADGVMGAKTFGALDTSDPVKVYYRLCAARMRLYVNIVLADSTQSAFLLGWTNRCMSFVEGRA